uniref:ubiquitinyl hydrolase 1 n=1 Tax=Salarias fasciatus TaxID=181472 RepID=A0A672F8X8_SALFA
SAAPQPVSLWQMEPEGGCCVHSREDISSLFTEETSNFKQKCRFFDSIITRLTGLQELSSQFCAVRRVRGDGNCFYRAFCFAHLESVLHNARALQRWDKMIRSSEALLSAGFEENSFRDHLNTVNQDVVEQCQAHEQDDALLRLFNQQPASDGAVQYLRLLTSAHLQSHAHFFCHFVEAPDLRAYCRQEVEAMAMESDHVDILALAQALDVCVHIVSMEGDERQLAHHVIPEGAEPSLHLLYQTSHYNILYPRTPPPPL